jgi:hypothetical protein
MSFPNTPAIASFLAVRPDLAAKLAADPVGSALLERYFVTAQGQAIVSAGDVYVNEMIANATTINWTALLSWLINNLPTIIAIVTTLIPLFAPAPAPTPVNPPDPPVIPVVS